MTLLIVVVALIITLVCIAIWLVVSLVKKRIDGGKSGYKQPLILLGILVVSIGFLTIYGFYLGFSIAKENKEKIISLGQETIANTIEYGTTAVLEGLGKTADHFEEKWDTRLMAALEGVTLSVEKLDMDNTNKLEQRLTISLVVSNTSETTIDMRDVVAENYLLLCDQTELCYPMRLANRNNSDMISGKTQIDVVATLPQDKEPHHLRFLDDIVLITPEQ